MTGHSISPTAVYLLYLFHAGPLRGPNTRCTIRIKGLPSKYVPPSLQDDLIDSIPATTPTLPLETQLLHVVKPDMDVLLVQARRAERKMILDGIATLDERARAHSKQRKRKLR